MRYGKRVPGPSSTVFRRLSVFEQDLERLVGNAFNTIFPDRIKINYRLNSRLVRARLALLERCGQGIGAAFAPDPSPWAEREPKVVLDRPLSELLAREMKISRQEGRSDPGLHSPRQETSRSLVDLIRLVRWAGAEPVIAITPERSVYRAVLPPEARRTLSTLLRVVRERGPAGHRPGVPGPGR
jgi:hypothetical protein